MMLTDKEGLLCKTLGASAILNIRAHNIIQRARVKQPEEKPQECTLQAIAYNITSSFGDKLLQYIAHHT